MLPGMDPDVNPDEEEEKRRLINQVLELQNTLDGEHLANAKSKTVLSQCQK